MLAQDSTQMAYNCNDSLPIKNGMVELRILISCQDIYFLTGERTHRQYIMKREFN